MLPGELAKPGIKWQRSLLQVVGQPLVRVEQSLRDHVGRIETRRQPTIEPHRDHPAQPIPMPHQELDVIAAGPVTESLARAPV